MIALYYTYILGSSWSWKFPHQSQNRSILPNWREKELLNEYFRSRTLFLLQNASERFFNAYWTLFFHSRTSEDVRSVPNGKNHSGVFFPHQPPKSIFFRFGVKQIQYWEAPGIYIIYTYICVCVYQAWAGFDSDEPCLEFLGQPAVVAARNLSTWLGLGTHRFEDGHSGGTQMLTYLNIAWSLQIPSHPKNTETIPKLTEIPGMLRGHLDPWWCDLFNLQVGAACCNMSHVFPLKNIKNEAFETPLSHLLVDRPIVGSSAASGAPRHGRSGARGGRKGVDREMDSFMSVNSL